MNYESFHTIDPLLAEQFLAAAKFNEQVSEWQQSLRDQIHERLKQLGRSGLGEPVYQDKRSTEYASIDDTAAAINDSVLNPLVAELKEQHVSFGENEERYRQVADRILEKHGLRVAIIVDDCLSLEDQFDFVAMQ